MENTRKYDFHDMSPYEGQDFEEAMERLRSYPQLLNNFTDLLSRHNRVINKWKSFHSKNKLARALNEVHNVDQFQKEITSDIFLDMIESTSMEDLTMEGIEELEDKPYIYISSHRDIVLDTALLDLCLYRSDRTLCEMIIGDNLVGNQFIEDMFRVNGAIITRRNLTSASDLKEETMRMSYYVRHAMLNKKKSIWVAQKSGRSKDGIDNTSSSIFKMLYLACRDQGKDFSTFLREQPVVPVAISYEYDPCAVTKSYSILKKMKNDVYKKKRYEDIIDMVKGLRSWKGNVHVHVGKPLDPDRITNPREAAAECDLQIHRNFKLWDTNYFCWDKINGLDKYADMYRDLNTKSFEKKYRKLNPDVVKNVYLQYANPVQSVLNDLENEKNG